MKLATYMKREEINDLEFAGRIGVDRSAVYRYRTGARIPEWSILERIVVTTSGQVTPNDFLKFDMETGHVGSE
jgi:transcriptional regulator with XRE-family HTH domain